MTSLPSLLRVARIVIVFWLLASLFYAGSFLYTSGNLTGRHYLKPDEDVLLHLDLEHPYFTEIQAAVQGFQDGCADRNRLKINNLPPIISQKAVLSSHFKLQTNTTQQLLHYQESSLSKRFVLLALGATHEYLSLGLVVLVVGTSWLLWQLMRDVTPVTPFTLANARRLQWLAGLILLLKVWHEVAYLLLRWVVPDFQLAGVPLPLSYYIRLSDTDAFLGLTVGLVLLVIAAVYRRGVALHQEAELTI